MHILRRGAAAILTVALVVGWGMPVGADQNGTRYLVRSSDAALEGRFGVRHRFERGFTADLHQRQSDILIAAAAEWLRLDAPEVGCAVVLRIGPWMSHIGMVLEGGKFIHASKGSGISVARLDDVQWIKRIAGFYRYGGRHE
mgnify:CR=1 FL=1